MLLGRIVAASSRVAILITFLLALAGCCGSEWCVFYKKLDALPAQQAEAEVEKLDDQDLLDFQAWQIKNSHPSTAPYRKKVVERGARIVPVIIDRLESGETSLVEMDLIDLLLEIHSKAPLSITDQQRKLVIRQCRAMYVQNASICASFEK